MSFYEPDGGHIAGHLEVGGDLTNKGQPVGSGGADVAKLNVENNADSFVISSFDAAMPQQPLGGNGESWPGPDVTGGLTDSYILQPVTFDADGTLNSVTLWLTRDPSVSDPDAGNLYPYLALIPDDGTGNPDFANINFPTYITLSDLTADVSTRKTFVILDGFTITAGLKLWIGIDLYGQPSVNYASALTIDAVDTLVDTVSDQADTESPPFTGSVTQHNQFRQMLNYTPNVLRVDAAAGTVDVEGAFTNNGQPVGYPGVTSDGADGLSASGNVQAGILIGVDAALGSGATAPDGGVSNWLAHGIDAKPFLDGGYAHGINKFNRTGDAQYVGILGKLITTDATTQTIGFGPMPDGECWQIVVQVTASRRDTPGTSAGWFIRGLVTKPGADGTYRLVGSPISETWADADASTWAASLILVDSSHGPRIQVIGEADQTIYWMAALHATTVGV